LVDTVVTQELIVDIEANKGIEEEANLHEPMVDTIITQEQELETKAYQGEDDTQKSLDEIAATQEPIVEMETNQ